MNFEFSGASCSCCAFVATTLVNMRIRRPSTFLYLAVWFKLFHQEDICLMRWMVMINIFLFQERVTSMFSSSPRSLTLKLAGNEQFWTVRLATQPSSSLWFSLLARRLSLLPLDLVSLCPNVMNPSKDSQLTPGDRAMFGQGWHTNRKGTAPSHQCPEPYLTTSPSHMFHVYFVSENLPEPYCLHIISTSAWYRVLWGCLLGGKLRSKQCAHSTRLSPILLVKYSPEQLADNPQTHTILHKHNCSTGSSQRTIMLQQLQG